MDLILNLILVFVGFLSFIPVLQLFKTSQNMKYRCLKFLVNATFIWTLFIFIERLSGNYYILYYVHLLGYPLKFLMSAFMFCTIFSYVEKKLPKYLILVFGIIFTTELIVAITNATSRYFLDLIPGEMTSYESLYSASNGPLFIVHLTLTYLVLIIAILFLVMFLRNNKGIRQYNLVSRTMTYSIFVVLIFNALQLLVFKSSVDMTYISLVIVTFALYRVIYSKDMIFNLKTSGRGEILSNMREMYIITDSEKRIVEISHLLQDKYDIVIDSFEGKHLNELLESLRTKIVFYEHYELEDNEDSKDHFHIREKKFTLKGMDEFGYMILLYDETQVFSLLRELNKLSNFDNMTGLHNRNFIESILPTYNNTPKIGVISLDLNGLKANNDYLGHERGDFLLKKLALIMKDVMSNKSSYSMARIGGDEFIIVLKDTNADMLESIRLEILDSCDNEELLDKISVSIGIAYCDDGCSIYELIQAADKDMYDMKKQTSTEYSKSIVLYATNKDEFIR